jgi:hypothetical protein
MITGITGRLIKTPLVNEKLTGHLNGKTAYDFTIAENRKRGDKETSTFYNVTLIAATENQAAMYGGLEKGTVVLFNGIQVFSVTGDKEKGSNNVYCDAKGLEIIASAGERSGGGGGGEGQQSSGQRRPAPMNAPAQQQRSGGGGNRQVPSRAAAPTIDEDPFDGPDDSKNPFDE